VDLYLVTSLGFLTVTDDEVGDLQLGRWLSFWEVDLRLAQCHDSHASWIIQLTLVPG
jgi:hypothetical protein